ncbi:MAG: class I SAM-dependent methyltransferase, partial [Anaerolineales bacterium]|nr:class I SAM-dependent methyltransferase [Anaerolineales bacterium]
MEFHFDNDQALPLGSPAKKFENNLQAIRLAKEITSLRREASADEQAILARYVGWGDSALLRQLNGSKELDQALTEDELRSLRGSTLNAHYTALPVIGAMWDALTFMGFGAGPVRIIDPSAGVGHFKSLMPMSFSTDWAEVELDSLTANILKLLHPESKVFAEGYERVDFPRNWFDLAISNVPFGDYGVVKRELPSFLRKSIHDFFFANTIALLRPGGILAFITSRYTLDKKDSSVRSWLARHLDLLAAVRLPNNAFKENAGTEVVTDVLFMRKRFEESKNVPDWVETQFFSQNYRQTNVNRYFMQHPEMILGIQGMDGTLYKSDGYTVNTDGRILG